MDNLSPAEQKRLQLIQTIQKYFAEGYNASEIARLTQKNNHTVLKYKVGDPEILCRSSANVLKERVHWNRTVRR